MDDHQIQKRNQPGESNITEGPGNPGLDLEGARPLEHVVILPEESVSVVDSDSDGMHRLSEVDRKRPPPMITCAAPVSVDLSMIRQNKTGHKSHPRQANPGRKVVDEMCNCYIHPEGPQGHTLNLGVKEHENNKDLDLLRAAYSMEGDDWRKILEANSVLEQNSPLVNILLHMAASCGNNEAAERLTQEAPNLRDRNSNGDTALHVAARAGNVSILQKLLATYFLQNSTLGQNILWPEDMKSLASSKNEEGNTFLHEALKSSEGMILQVLEAPLAMNKEDNSLRTLEANFKTVVKEVASSITNNENKSVLYLAIEAGYKDVVNGLLNQDPYPPIFGKSPLLGAIMKRNQEMLEIILSKKPAWIHLMDPEGRTPLHYAASIGYIEGVCYLLGKCNSCAIERDKYGFYPLHLASDGGHVEVIDKLLENCWVPPENIVDRSFGRNILHIAAASGKLNVVNHILRTRKLRKMINQKDAKGNTPLHVASLCCHPRIVHVLTWDRKVDLTLTNRGNQTALDAMEQIVEIENPPLSQRLTWSALKSAGAKSSIKISPQGTPSSAKRKAANPEQFKDRIDIFLVVSTLIITATFAAGFTMPGGNGSDPEPGIANMINHSMFHLFILSNTISLYGAISVTIILIWCRLGDLSLLTVALKVALPLLGVTLANLSLSFLAGVYLVISKLSWLAITFLIVSAVFVLMIVLLCALLLLPSSSSNSVKRRLSYYPFIVYAKVAESESKGKPNRSITFSAYT